MHRRHNEQKRVLMTGATGAVGQELLKELLKQGYIVFCIIRGKKDVTAEMRLHEITSHPNAIAIQGDITWPNCGVSDVTALGKIDKIIHCAADVRFDEKHDKEIKNTNINGTRNMLALANRLGGPEFHYVGTTYIAGDADILEETPVGIPLKVGKSRNTYERTKRIAEKMVRLWRRGQVSIYRPSIVIGNSVNGSTSTFDGYYGFFKGPWFIACKLRAKGSFEKPIKLQPNGLLHLPIVIQAQANTTLNLIPQDWLAKTMAKLIAIPAHGECYNLSHPSQMNVGDVIMESLPIIGVEGILVLSEMPEDIQAGVQRWQEIVTSNLKKFAPYVTHEPSFVCKNAKRDLGYKYRQPRKITPKFLRLTLTYAVGKWSEERNKKNDSPSERLVA